MWAKGQNFLRLWIFSLLLSMIYFFSTLVETGSRTSRRWRPPDGTEFRFHGWRGHWKGQKHEYGSFFSLLSGQNTCTQSIKELSATSLWTMRWTLHGQTLKSFYANLHAGISGQLFAKKREWIPLCPFILLLFIYLCVELLCICTSKKYVLIFAGCCICIIQTRLVWVFCLSNKECFDVSAASSSELNTGVVPRGRVFNLFFSFLLWRSHTIRKEDATRNE